MDVLTDQSNRAYMYTSRYNPFPIYYNEKDQKYIRGITAQLKKDTPYVKIKVTKPTTLDMLASKYYGRPDYYWVIADFNNISDPFITFPNSINELKIPTITLIEFEDTVN